MRRTLWLVGLALGCTADEPADGPTIEFLVAGSESALPTGAPIEVSLRPQGVYGAHVDMRVVGIEAIAPFSIALVGPDDRELARQPFLPTSTAQELPDGSFLLTELPVVFFEGIEPAEVDGAPAVLRGEMQTTPPAVGECDVVLEAT